MGSTEDEASTLWTHTFMYLELDMQSQRDLMLLVHSGYVGRSEANFILWSLLTKRPWRLLTGTSRTS